MFGTVEDLFTQSFVLPYLTPMLENAGATILIPRERDTQIHEIIIDNDRSTPGSEYKELDGEKAWSDGRKLDLGIFKLLIRMGRTLLRKAPIGRRSHRGKEKKVSSSGFPKFRNRGITRSMPPINLFRTAQSRHCIPSIMPEGKPRSPSIKRWGVELGSIWEISNSRHMEKPMRESY